MRIAWWQAPADERIQSALQEILEGWTPPIGTVSYTSIWPVTDQPGLPEKLIIDGPLDRVRAFVWEDLRLIQERGLSAQNTASNGTGSGSRT